MASTEGKMPELDSDWYSVATKQRIENEKPLYFPNGKRRPVRQAKLKALVERYGGTP